MNRYQALQHAVRAHAGQLDKCGQPYVLHPMAVAEAIPSSHPLPDEEQSYIWALGNGQEDCEVIALLHDVWEDTDYREHLDGLSHTQMRATQAITRGRPDETYAKYIERVCDGYGGSLAMVVKLADLWHNLQPERQACLPAKERASLEKRYLKARDRIWEALGVEWWPEGSAR